MGNIENILNLEFFMLKLKIVYTKHVCRFNLHINMEEMDKKNMVVGMEEDIEEGMVVDKEKLELN